MGLIERISNLWTPKASTPGPLDDFWYNQSPYMSSAGVKINPDTAMQITAVYACVRVISETIGSLPLILYKNTGDSAKERAIEHPLYKILQFRPNHYQTAFEFWEQVGISCCMRGVFYAKIVLSRSGQVEALLPLHPDRMWIESLAPYKWRYRYHDEFGNEKYFMPDELFRVLLYSEPDGITPISPIRANADSVGITEAAERYAANYFGNSATPGGSLEADGRLTDEAKKAVGESWNRMFRGPDKAGKIAVLDQGLKFKQITINNDDSQLLETRQFQLTDIARIFRVPPHLIQDLTRSTFSNIEHQSLDFVTHTARPWLRRIGQCVQRDLLLDNELDQYFAEFWTKDLMAADAKARAEYNASGIQNGWMTPNEARVSEGLNPLDDLDEPMIPNNLRKLSDPPPTAAPPGKEPGQQSTSKGNSDK
jgi:HK97 family phage portal protein